MAENTQEATIIEASAEDVTEASEKKSMNLSLIVAVLALVVSAIALVFVIRDNDPTDFSETQGTFESIEARLKAIEAAPKDGSANLSLLEGELASVKSSVDQVEADLAATIAALNTELDRVTASLDRADVVPAAAAEPTALMNLDEEGALSSVNAQIADLAETMDGSLARLGELSTDFASNQTLVANLTERLQNAEGALNDLPAQVSEQIAVAIEDVRASSNDQIAGLQSSIDAGMSAFADLSSQTDSALSETRSAVTAQFEETSAAFSERLASVQSTMSEQMSALSTTLDEAKALTAEQLAVVAESMSGLSDEFTALKEVSVETSTKVLAVNQLRDALASSAPVRSHMSSLEALNPTEAPLLSVLSTVDAIADMRVPTQQILAETIQALSPKLINETRINSAEGRGGKVIARLESLVSIEKIEDISAIPGIEGNMARASARVLEGDYDAALTELLDDTVEMNLSPETQARFDGLVTDLGNRATYEDQRRILGDWVTTTLNSARASVSN
ncbi:MAG: hypothetical protein ACPG40_00165 [Alphaproteobacteria bacterium]